MYSVNMLVTLLTSLLLHSVLYSHNVSAEPILKRRIANEYDLSLNRRAENGTSVTVPISSVSVSTTPKPAVPLLHAALPLVGDVSVQAPRAAPVATSLSADVPSNVSGLPVVVNVGAIPNIQSAAAGPSSIVISATPASATATTSVISSPTSVSIIPSPAAAGSGAGGPTPGTGGPITGSGGPIAGSGGLTSETSPLVVTVPSVGTGGSSAGGTLGATTGGSTGSGTSSGGTTRATTAAAAASTSTSGSTSGSSQTGNTGTTTGNTGATTGNTGTSTGTSGTTTGTSNNAPAASASQGTSVVLTNSGTTSPVASSGSNASPSIDNGSGSSQAGQLPVVAQSSRSSAAGAIINGGNSLIASTSPGESSSGGLASSDTGSHTSGTLVNDGVTTISGGVSSTGGPPTGSATSGTPIVTIVASVCGCVVAVGAAVGLTVRARKNKVQTEDQMEAAGGMFRAGEKSDIEAFPYKLSPARSLEMPPLDHLDNEATASPTRYQQDFLLPAIERTGEFGMFESSVVPDVAIPIIVAASSKTADWDAVRAAHMSVYSVNSQYSVPTSDNSRDSYSHVIPVSQVLAKQAHAMRIPEEDELAISRESVFTTADYMTSDPYRDSLASSFDNSAIGGVLLSALNESSRAAHSSMRQPMEETDDDVDNDDDDDEYDCEVVIEQDLTRVSAYTDDSEFALGENDDRRRQSGSSFDSSCSEY